MKKWQLVCSIDADLVDYETTIESESEPDFLYCNEIAQKHGYTYFYVYELEN